MTLVFSGCKKETNDPQEPAKVQTYQMSIQASKGADNQANGPRRVIGLGTDGETLTATWQTGDVVTVFNLTRYTGLKGKLTAESDGVNTLLTGTLSGTVEVGDNLQLRYQTSHKYNPEYKNQNGTLEYISANCDYATATVTVTAVNDGVITTDADATFQNEQAIFKFTLLNNANGAELNATELIVNVDGDTYTVTPESATNEMYVAISFEPYSGPRTVTLTATAADGTYTKAVTIEDDVLANGQYYRITVSMTKQTAPAYKEYGPFSVSPTQKVNFAQGNLKFTRTSTSDAWSTGKFSFMDNQYDYIETTNVSGDYANETAIGLFGWATSNSNTPANTYYYPWETDKTSTSYGSGITTADVNWSDNDNAFANYDWGKNMGDGWRTLTNDEWKYLFNTTNSSDASFGRQATYRFAKAKLFGTTYGIILFPDNYVHPSGVAAVAGLNATGNTSWNGNMYNATDWKKMEDAGCVFLPAAGFRNGTSMMNVGSCGYYWSSTSYSNTKAYFMYFTEKLVLPPSLYDRYYGFSVRLVKNVE